jgi:hypothetical protein
MAKNEVLPERMEMSDFYFFHNKVVPAYLYIVSQMDFWEK